MKKIAILLVVFTLFAAQAARAENSSKIGIVDLVKALNESERGKKAKVELEAMIKIKQKDLNEKGTEIEKMKAELEKQSSVLSTEARKTREDDLERAIREYQRMASDSQTDVKKKENELTGEIVKDLRALIQKLGQEGGYGLIIENAEGIVLFSKKDMDLTETVIKKYNAQNPADKK